MKRLFSTRILGLSILVWFVAVALVSLVVVFLPKTEMIGSLPSRTGSESASEVAPLPHRSRGPNHQARSLQNTRAERDLAKDEFFGRWRDYVQNDIYEAMAERDALAAETIERLSFSEELFSLVRQLDELGIYHTIDAHIYTLFSTSDAAEMRLRFSDIAKSGNLSEGQKHKWGSHIGKTLSPEEFDGYYATLADACPETASWAKFSHMIHSESPILDRVNNLLEVAEHLPGSRSSYYELEIGNLIRNHADESVIEEMRDFIQETEDNGGKSGFLWNAWLSAWAKVDPISAANHVIDHPDRFTATSLAQVISDGFSFPEATKDPHELAKWTESFPEGPYRDEVLRYAVQRLRHTNTEGAKMLIEKIKSEQLRYELRTSIEHREKYGPDQN